MRSLMKLASVSAAGFMLTGCMFVTSGEKTIPVAMWPSFEHETSATSQPSMQSTQPAPSTGDAAAAERSPEKWEGWRARELVREVLADAGVRAVVDETGVRVPAEQEGKARRALYTDKRMERTSVLVILLVPAGTGTKTSDGYLFREVAPEGAVMSVGSNR